jgi:hypothetical protein
MSMQVPTFKKRRSFITLVKKNTHNHDLSLLELERSDCSTPEHEWKSFMLGGSVAGNREGYATARRQRILSGWGEKENVGTNRAIIRIKPRKFMGSCHFLVCKQTEDRS